VKTTQNLDHERTLAVMFGEEAAFYGLIKDIARQLRAAREKAGLSQRALAEEMNTAQGQVARLEKGETFAVTLRSIHSMADALECDLYVEVVPR
jgi:ribosome-binding protein aMBF1 (putative translation factor)